MFVQHSEMKGDKVVALKKDGPTVQVFEQTQDGQVVFGEPGTDREDTEALPSHEFFMTHRDATGDEIDKATERARPKPALDPVPALEAVVKRAEAAADRAEKAAQQATSGSNSALKSADNAKAAAAAAAASAKEAAKPPAKP